jgi:hypothetical protein
VIADDWFIPVIKKLLAAIVSLGWLAPAYFWWTLARRAAQLRIAGEEGLHSFPFEAEARRMLIIAAVWFAVAAVYWLVRLALLRLTGTPRSTF